MADPFLGRREQMFPRLTPAQIERVANVGKRRRITAGEVLFEPGDRNTWFFVIVEGEVEILRPVGGAEELIVTHGPGQFTGEINMLSARSNLVRGRVARDGEV